MAHVLLIGNGFDLAHGLKTQYAHFMETLVRGGINGEEDLYICNNPIYQVDIDTFSKHISGGVIDSKNDFFRNLLEIKPNLQRNWSDIESFYFKQLQNRKGSPDLVQELNREFEQIKRLLQDYLVEEQKSVKQIESFRWLFQELARPKDAIIVDFNYTNLIANYILGNSNLRHIKMHGELHSSTNPIIFGYAASHQESRELLNEQSKEFLRNIKKHCYKRTTNEVSLKNLLNQEGQLGFHVHIIGLSCGPSDKLILNEIFNHVNLKSITIYYHDAYEHFFETQVNIDRIQNEDSKFSLVSSFDICPKMPQSTESEEELAAFKDKLTRILSS